MRRKWRVFVCLTVIFILFVSYKILEPDIKGEIIQTDDKGLPVAKEDNSGLVREKTLRDPGDIVIELQKKYRLNFNYPLKESPWRVAEKMVKSREIHPEYAPEIDGITITSCSGCGQSVCDEEFIQKASGLEEDCQRCLEEAKAAKQSKDPERILNICERCMKCYADLFHPLNISLVKILDYAFDAAVDLQQWEKAVNYGSRTLPAYRKYYPPYSPNVGIQLLKLGKIQLYLQNLKEALVYLQQANDILSVTHGRDHTLYKQLIELLDQSQEEMRTRLENGS